jgi:hypothetical protein
MVAIVPDMKKKSQALLVLDEMDVRNENKPNRCKVFFRWLVRKGVWSPSKVHGIKILIFVHCAERITKLL